MAVLNWFFKYSILALCVCLFLRSPVEEGLSVHSFEILQKSSHPKIFGNLIKTPVVESLYNKVTGLQTCNFIKKRFQCRCFPADFANFLRTTFFHRTWNLWKPWQVFIYDLTFTLVAYKNVVASPEAFEAGLILRWCKIFG